jgi:hypothetical protein
MEYRPNFEQVPGSQTNELRCAEPHCGNTSKASNVPKKEMEKKFGVTPLS